MACKQTFNSHSKLSAPALMLYIPGEIFKRVAVAVPERWSSGRPDTATNNLVMLAGAYSSQMHYSLPLFDFIAQQVCLMKVCHHVRCCSHGPCNMAPHTAGTRSISTTSMLASLLLEPDAFATLAQVDVALGSRAAWDSLVSLAHHC
jgi:hypothetical protein